MDPSEAREHLDLVDRILTRTDQNVCLVGDIFIAWGLAGAFVDIGFQLVAIGKISAGWPWAAAMLAALIGAVVYTMRRVRNLQATVGRMTMGARAYVNVIWVVFALTTVVQIGAFRFFTGWSGSALWTLAASIVTWYVAVSSRNLYAAIGGVVLVASLIVASYVALPGYVLAAGMLLGYAGFGVAAVVTRD